LELYDLEKDLGERDNLATIYPEKTRELLKKLNMWRLKMKAPVPTEINPKYDPNFEYK